MDEPFGAIDPITRTRLQDEFLRLQGELQKTVVFVTHDIDEAVRMGTRIALLNVGAHLEQYDTPAVLLGRPATPFVADFVGSDRALKRLQVTCISRDDIEPTPGCRARSLRCRRCGRARRGPRERGDRRRPRRADEIRDHRAFHGHRYRRIARAARRIRHCGCRPRRRPGPGAAHRRWPGRRDRCSRADRNSHDHRNPPLAQAFTGRGRRRDDGRGGACVAPRRSGQTDTRPAVSRPARSQPMSRIVWLAPVRNLRWVSAHFGHR